MITDEQIARTDNAGGIGHAAVLEWLINQYILPRHPDECFTFLEIGVWSAVCATYLLEKYPGMVYDGVDPYEAFQDVNQERVDIAKTIGLARLEKFPNATLHIGTSAKASLRFADGGLDLVFIDGNHSYESCLQDMQLWWPKVRGVMAGHEYALGIDHSYNGVVRAVRDFCAAEHLTYQGGDQMVWWIVREDANV